jgi:hypothetical protein
MTVFDRCLEDSLKEARMSEIRTTAFNRFVSHSYNNAIWCEASGWASFQEIWCFFSSLFIFLYPEIKDRIVTAIHGNESFLGLISKLSCEVFRDICWQ